MDYIQSIRFKRVHIGKSVPPLVDTPFFGQIQRLGTVKSLPIVIVRLPNPKQRLSDNYRRTMIEFYFHATYYTPTGVQCQVGVIIEKSHFIDEYLHLESHLYDEFMLCHSHFIDEYSSGCPHSIRSARLEYERSAKEGDSRARGIRTLVGVHLGSLDLVAHRIDPLALRGVGADEELAEIGVEILLACMQV